MIDEARKVRARILYDAATAEAMERLRFTTSLAESGLKGLTIINGGAIVALFTLIGNVGTKVPLDTRYLWPAFTAFVVGLVLTFLANLGGYVSQDRFYTVSALEANNAVDVMGGIEPDRAALLTAQRQGNHALLFGVGCAVLSLAAFILGAGFALAGVLPG